VKKEETGLGNLWIPTE